MHPTIDRSRDVVSMNPTILRKSELATEIRARNEICKSLSIESPQVQNCRVRFMKMHVVFGGVSH